MKVLAKISSPASPELRPGSLRRSDLDAYGDLLDELGGASCLTVTGYGPGGRSVAAGVATTAAARGARSVLLECDMTDPALADELGLANAPGLHEYLRGDAEVAAILKPVVLAGPGSGGATEPLVCVVAGRPTGDGSALLASARFRDAVEGVRAAYEQVVIAAPPLRDEDGRALRPLLDAADATILCVAPGESRRKPPIPITGLVVLD